MTQHGPRPIAELNACSPNALHRAYATLMPMDHALIDCLGFLLRNFHGYFSTVNPAVMLSSGKERCTSEMCGLQTRPLRRSTECFVSAD